MTTKTISSTDAQNNFGRILDDILHNAAKYVVQRRNQSQVVLISLSEFERLLSAADGERQELSKILRELSPSYNLGQPVK